jgi:hypothetical protein
MDAKRISLVSGAALLALTATASAGPINVANSYYGHYAYDGAHMDITVRHMDITATDTMADAAMTG